MKIALAQTNPIIADITGNIQKIKNFIDAARKLNADLVIFPELSITGYPPMDLLEHKKLTEDNLAALDEIARYSTGIAVICGYVDVCEEFSPLLYNSAAFIENGHIVYKQHKTLLPTYDVFDEQRYFYPAHESAPVCFKGISIGITICEDIWNEDSNSLSAYMDGRKYANDPIEYFSKKEIDLLVNISASPFVKGKNTAKWKRVSGIAKTLNAPVVYVNQCGGNDSLVFDGASFVAMPDGSFTAAAKQFSEDIVIFDLSNPGSVTLVENEIEEIEQALVTGLRDYVTKCGFKGALIGLSGGIDSALTAVLAAKALGPENVIGITMPSQYSSGGSIDDSYSLAKNLGIRIETIPIKPIFERFREDLAGIFTGYKDDVTEENIQARIRGNLLMSISNKFGMLLLTTGNKSEIAMGYCTLYGDMSGGLAVISDLPKTLVYELSGFINRSKEIIPWNSIEKAPSAELRDNQKDQDTLPPYEVLDAILEAYIEKRESRGEIIAQGFDRSIVDFVLKTVDRNEYKRRQAAPGIKVTSKAFGIGRRNPIAQKFIP
jgi:NAD+ synthase (glutamine-hydrolysing)